MTQLDLFGCQPATPSAPQTPDTDRIRTLLMETLEQLRAAEKLPWDAAQLRSWDHVFHNMTKWLPSEQRDEFIRNFEGEISRLQQSASFIGSTR
jgi:hypothetical protein